jgi:hypothetical protein
MEAVARYFGSWLRHRRFRESVDSWLATGSFFEIQLSSPILPVLAALVNVHRRSAESDDRGASPTE